MIKKRLSGLSLFSGAGIGETYLKDIGIDIKVANELVEKRADLYKALSRDTTVICGDITRDDVFQQVIAACPEKLDFLLASPPCQGMSIAGKNRCQATMENDQRNYLITYVVKAIKRTSPTYVLIENVPALLKLKLMYDGQYRTVLEILEYEFGEDYCIDSNVIDAADCGVPQTRLRAIIKMHKQGTIWNWPAKKEKVTVAQAIGHLPSLEAGESSDIPWHFARPHSPSNILWMKHTPTGKSAFSNPVYFPQKKDGTRVIGYESSYRRIRWDAPAPTITIRNDCIASQRNVHPGRLLPDGTYSDARVLTPLELMLLNSLPADWNIPADTPELLIRQCIGESIPPLMLKEIASGIFEDTIQAISLFSGAGIGELLLRDTNIHVAAANELLPKRAECYRHFYPETDMYCGDITLEETKDYMIAAARKNRAKMLIATPPCQGLSTLGKNKKQIHYEKDKRNFLILSVFDVIDACDFDYILIENVPKFLDMYFPYEDDYYKLEEILNKRYSGDYRIEARVLNAKDYGICQSRPRAIIKLYKHGLKWGWPTAEEEIPLSAAIGHLPSLESGESSDIPWHFAKVHNERTVLALKHTPTGKSAIANEIYYPKKEDGTRIKGFHNTFKRMQWDQPCPARTTFSGSMSSHNNVHPGRLLPDGTYSDARVLTLLETFIVSSIPQDIVFPKDSTDTFIRTVIGESIPPKLMKKVVEMIGKEVPQMPKMVERNKWILYKHTSSYELIKAVALDVKNSCKTDISQVERERMQERLAALNLYKTRNAAAKPLDSINHRINTLEYFMFGYEDCTDGKRFMFSPLGNLFLKHIQDEEKLTKIFTAMLFAIQFQHPASGTDKEFQLYPFRLIFKLLLDPRLEGRLHHYEYALAVAFVTSMDDAKYEELVSRILALRKLSDPEIGAIYQTEPHTYVNAVYEWEYYTCKLLSTIGILNMVKGDMICKLYHPTKPGSRSKPTPRTARNGYVSLNPAVQAFVEKLLGRYSFAQAPLKLDDPERMALDVVKEIYSFYPPELMEEIGESDELSSLLELPKLIEEYANNPDNDTAYLFEEVLAKGFDMFHNVDARRRGGAGHTDIECLYLPRKKKFAVESKSTANKLSGINIGRLREHREEIGAAYTIVITPRYVPAAKRDIKGSDVVIILASTFAEYLYNHIFHEIREIDFADFDDIIVQHLGEDVSKYISNMTMQKFAAR